MEGQSLRQVREVFRTQLFRRREVQPIIQGNPCLRPRIAQHGLNKRGCGQQQGGRFLRLCPGLNVRPGCAQSVCLRLQFRTADGPGWPAQDQVRGIGYPALSGCQGLGPVLPLTQGPGALQAAAATRLEAQIAAPQNRLTYGRWPLIVMGIAGDLDQDGLPLGDILCLGQQANPRRAQIQEGRAQALINSLHPRQEDCADQTGTGHTLNIQPQGQAIGIQMPGPALCGASFNVYFCCARHRSLILKSDRC